MTLTTKHLYYPAFFQRKSDKKLASIATKLAAQKAIIAKANKRISTLELQCEKAKTEYFCGFKIVVEFQGEKSYGMNYDMMVDLPSIRMQARVHPNAHEDGRTFVAALEEKGTTGVYPDWYYKFPRYQKGIATFEEAKEMTLTWLKELIEEHYKDEGNKK